MDAIYTAPRRVLTDERMCVWCQDVFTQEELDHISSFYKPTSAEAALEKLDSIGGRAMHEVRSDWMGWHGIG